MPTNTGVLQSIAVQAWEQTFAGPGHHTRMVLILLHHVSQFRVLHIPLALLSKLPARHSMIPIDDLLGNTQCWRCFMKSHLMTALLITVSATAMAAGERLDSATAGPSDHSQPASNAEPAITDRANTSPSVPGRSYRDQAPPRYRIEQGSSGSTKAFPRVPGTSFKSYSRPSYNTR